MKKVQKYKRPSKYDRVILSLQIIRWHLVKTICDIDEQTAYLERAKKCDKN